jgi:hypothetical protein
MGMFTHVASPLNVEIRIFQTLSILQVIRIMEVSWYNCKSPTVPDDWASVEISNSTGQNALHNTDYALVCTVTTIPGMNFVPSVEWVGPDGGVVVSGGNINVGEVESQGRVYTLTLSFSPVLTTDGGRYTCRGAIIVPWMNNQLLQILNLVNMPVTSEWYN